jgi:hypothetical protein
MYGVLPFESDRSSLGNWHTSPQSVFVGDCLKDQDPTVEHGCPAVGKEDCVYHLKDNMKDTRNGVFMEGVIHIRTVLI